MLDMDTKKTTYSRNKLVSDEEENKLIRKQSMYIEGGLPSAFQNLRYPVHT